MSKKGKRIKKTEFSKKMSALTLAAGFIIAQECLLLIAYTIRNGFTATAAYLSAAVGLSQAIILAAPSFYLSLAKSQNTEGGITFEMAKLEKLAQMQQEESSI